MPSFKQALQMGRRDAVRGSGNGRGREAQMGRRNAVRGTQRQRTSLRECSAHIVAVAAATPQERAAAAVPALRRGANNERWCCCQLAATAASRLRAPMFQALPAFHVQCSSLTPAGVVWSSLRRAAAGEGAEAHDLQSGEVSGACRSGRRRWGARSAVRRRGDVFLGACRRGRGR